MAGTHGHFIRFLYIFKLDFCSHCYSSLMKLCQVWSKRSETRGNNKVSRQRESFSSNRLIHEAIRPSK